MNLKNILEVLKQTIWEMSVRTEFRFEPAKMDYKAKELYSRVLVDNIAPYYFVVIRESKYQDDLDKLSDKYRASIEFQPMAYSIKDYNINKAQVYSGLVHHFSEFKAASSWLKKCLKEYFEFQPIDVD